MFEITALRRIVKGETTIRQRRTGVECKRQEEKETEATVKSEARIK